MIWREQFVNEKDKPVAGLRVTILDRHPVSHPKSHSPWLTRYTDAEGWAEADLDPGDYKFVAAGQTTYFRIAADGTVAWVGSDAMT